MGGNSQMVDQAKIERVVQETMAANADLEGIVICDAKGKVVFGHTISGGTKHSDVADLAVKIAANSSQLSAGLDKGGLKEVSIASDHGFIIILGDVKLVLAGIAGEGARESLGLLRMALRRALLQLVA
jgi:predicted regulator of Ras-like GTPase activity (Roadblock/LC7/MglB family)